MRVISMRWHPATSCANLQTTHRLQTKASDNTATDDRYRPRHISKNYGHDKWPVGVWTRQGHHEIVCANSTRCESCEHTACMCQKALQTIFQSVAIAKLLYASSAWSGFIKAIDRQRVDGFLCRSVRRGYCSPDVPTFAEQCATANEQYFEKICSNSNHVLHRLLPPLSTASQNYNLRPRVQSTATATLLPFNIVNLHFIIFIAIRQHILNRLAFELRTTDGSLTVYEWMNA